MASDMRQRLLDGALRCVASIGLGRLTVEDVAEASAVSRQTVYRYFGSRDALIEAVILREEQVLLARLTAAVQRHEQQGALRHRVLVRCASVYSQVAVRCASVYFLLYVAGASAIQLGQYSTFYLDC